MSKSKHHIRDSVCGTRAPYREGRKAKAVKVYAVHQESKYLLVQGIPGVGATKNLVELFEAQGEIAEHRMLDEYPTEQFTEACLIKYKKIQSARYAKRHLDDWSFFGGVLHVCYAPEYESIKETREKLQDRRKVIAAKVRQFSMDGTYSRNTVASNDTHMTHASQHNSDAHEPGTSLIQTGSQIMHQKHPLPSSGIENQALLNTLSTNENAQISNSYESPQQYSENREEALETRTYESEHLKCSDSSVLSSKATFSDYLVLPPPPKQRKITHFANNRQIKNTQWRVPSAQATFPPDFDARTNKLNVQERSEDSGVTLSEYLARKGPNTVEPTEETVEDKPKSVQDVIEENLKASNLVIKKVSQNPSAPRFIPRQTQARFKPKPANPMLNTSATVTNETDSNKKIDDKANSELRKNAFTLGKSQGPVDLEELERERPSLEDVSVQKTVRQIRKKLTEVSNTTDPVQPKDR